MSNGYSAGSEVRTMARQELVDALKEYRRPGSPVYSYHFRRLPAEIVRTRNVPALLSILEDEDLPARAREHAAGALGERGARRAVRPGTAALAKPGRRRGAPTALGLMKAKEAAERLRALAPRVGAARWALSQVSAPTTTRGVIDDLQTGQLRDIGPKIGRLQSGQAGAVSRELIDRLEEVVAAGALSPESRWIVTALQYLAPAKAAEALIEALSQAIGLDGCCGCLLNRTMRALGEIRPLGAVPVLVDVVCRADNPVHKHLAAVCIEKVVAQHDGEALSLLAEHALRLARELECLEKAPTVIASAAPETAWDASPGTPRWSARQSKAIGAVRRLLAMVRA